MKDLIVGVDISKASFVAAEGSEGARKKFENSDKGFEKFREWLSDERAWVCLEATGSYGFKLAAWLVEHGYRVSVVNPARVKSFADSELARNKTDKSDASLLARFCVAHRPEEWEPQGEKARKLQQLVRRLRDLKKARTREKNRLQEPHFTEEMRDSIRNHIEFLDKQIEQIWGKTRKVVDSDDNLKEAIDLVESIPGIGEKTAIIVVGEIQDIDRFTSAKALAAHTGVTPENVQSGTSRNGPASMSKKGSADLRGCLYMPALTAKTHNRVVNAFCNRLENRGKDKAVVIGAAMHKLIRLVYGVWKNREPFDPEYALSA